MNAEESVAKGCSLACALVSPLIKLNKKYRLIDTQPVAVTLTWKTFNDPHDTKETSIELFPRKQHYGKAKFVTLARKEAKPFDLVAQYVSMQSFPIPDISNGVIVTARVPKIAKEPDPQGNRDADIRLKIKLDTNGLTHILDTELVEKKEVEVEIEEKEETPAPGTTPNPQTTAPNPAVPGGTPDTDMKDAEHPQTEKPPEQQQSNPDHPPQSTPDIPMKDAEPAKPEPAKRKFRKEKQMRTFYTPVHMDMKFIEHSPAEIEKFIQAEEVLRGDDNYALETLNAKNRLESSIFSTRDNLSSIWERFSQPQEVADITKFLLDLEDWLYNDGTDETKEEYDKKFTEEQILLSPILGRYNAELKRIEDEKRAKEEELKKIEEEKKKIEEEKKKKEEEEKQKAEEEKKQSEQQQQQQPPAPQTTAEQNPSTQKEVHNQT
jgi:hypothetical protein